jgi:hypothetical protein
MTPPSYHVSILFTSWTEYIKALFFVQNFEDNRKRILNLFFQTTAFVLMDRQSDVLKRFVTVLYPKERDCNCTKKERVRDVTLLKSFMNLRHVQRRKLADQVTDYKIQRVKFSSSGKRLAISLAPVYGNIRHKKSQVPKHINFCAHKSIRMIVEPHLKF